MSGSAPPPGPAGRPVRAVSLQPPRWARAGFGVYLLVEFILLIMFAKRFGPVPTLLILASTGTWGLLMLARLPQRRGERGLDVLAAVLLIAPGLLASLFGAALTAAPIRRWVRNRTQSWIRRQGLVPPTTGPARPDVVAGEVIEAEIIDDPPSAPRRVIVAEPVDAEIIEVTQVADLTDVTDRQDDEQPPTSTR